jgi:hypothetical protein
VVGQQPHDGHLLHDVCRATQQQQVSR